VSMRGIAQATSERNISWVIDTAQQTPALSIIHGAFFERRKRRSLFVIGTGSIGGTLLRQLHKERPYLVSRGFDVSVIGLANSKRFVLDAGGINLGRWREKLAASRRRIDPRILAREIAKLQLTDAAVV